MVCLSHKREREKGVNHLAHPCVPKRYHPSSVRNEQPNKTFEKALGFHRKDLRTRTHIRRAKNMIGSRFLEF